MVINIILDLYAQTNSDEKRWRANSTEKEKRVEYFNNISEKCNGDMFLS
jgi:hypothetical protein